MSEKSDKLNVAGLSAAPLCCGVGLRVVLLPSLLTIISGWSAMCFARYGGAGEQQLDGIGDPRD